MYVLSVLLLLFIVPAGCVLAEALIRGAPDLLWLIGKWFTFWACGVRLIVAGLRQTFDPAFTAREIFRIDDPAAHPMVREIGFGNLAMGTLALASLAVMAWMTPGAIVGGLYYGLAGLGHALNKERNTKAQVALISDLWIFLLLAVFVASRLT
jgi:Family of unknown function (DUF6790)